MKNKLLLLIFMLPILLYSQRNQEFNNIDVKNKLYVGGQLIVGSSATVDLNSDYINANQIRTIILLVTDSTYLESLYINGYIYGNSIKLDTNNIIIGTSNADSLVGTGNIFIGYDIGNDDTISNRLIIHNGNRSDPLIEGNFNSSYIIFRNNIILEPVSVGQTQLGSIFFDEADSTLKVWDGIKWKSCY